MSLPGLDGHAAAVGVVRHHHAVHVGVLGQQLFPDALHRHVDHAGGALDGGNDAQQVAGTRRAVGIAVAQPGGAGRIGQLLRGNEVGAVGHVLQPRGLGQLQHVLVDPGPHGDGVLGIAEDHPVADDLSPLGDVGQGELMGLGDVLPGGHAGHHLGARGDVLHGNGHVVLALDLDKKRCRHYCPLFLKWADENIATTGISSSNVHLFFVQISNRGKICRALWKMLADRGWIVYPVVGEDLHDVPYPQLISV